MEILIWVLAALVIVSLLLYFREFITSLWLDGGRGQFLVMGMPAVIIFFLGVGAYAVSTMTMDRLDLKYQSLAQRAGEDSKELVERLRQVQNVAGGSAEDSVEAREVVVDELKKSQKAQQIYLEKLIDLEPDDPSHKFEHALLAYNQGDLDRALSLMQLIAPFDEPGYAPAHLFLARYYLQQRTTSNQVKAQNLRFAEASIKYCLVADEKNTDAKRLNAYILEQQGKYQPALSVYEDLFETEPKHYIHIIRLYRLLDRPDDAKSYLAQAGSKFRTKTKKSIDNVAEWVDAWTHYVQCMKLIGTSKSFKDAESAVKNELANFNDEIGRKVFLKRLLSTIYSDHAVLLGKNASLPDKERQLQYLSNAIENDEKNVTALHWLTILGLSEMGDQARRIYDADKDPNPPPSVLAELGQHALRNKQWDKAVTYFEKARQKDGKNPQTLNNLAFALLSSPDNNNGERALILIDQAIVYLKQANLEPVIKEQAVASFFDTRGLALMKLGRFKDAAISLELASRSRPNSKEIVQRLIECYQELGNEPLERASRRKLAKLNQVESQ